MGSHPGRNDPCPCGSGRKYKHCCAAASADVEAPGDLAWRRMRRLLADGGPPLLRFVKHAYGEGALEEAWKEFCLPGEFDTEPVTGVDYTPMFMSWLYNFWSPDPYDEATTVPDKTLHGVQPLRAYLDKHAARLDPMLREYYESCLVEPLAFYRVESVDPGKGVKLHDVLAGGERDVLERLASQSVKPGDVVCAQVVRVSGLWMIECTSPFSLPPIHEIAIADFFRDIIGRRKKSFSLRDYDLEVLSLFHELAAPLFEQTPPKLQNMDGDPVSMRKVVFDIESAEAAFAALRFLDPGDDAQLARDQQRGVDGRMEVAQLTWVIPARKAHGATESIVHGTLAISATRLVAEVNSEAREAALRKIVEKALGGAARYRATEIQSLEAMMAASGRLGPGSGPSKADRELAESPEMQAYLKEQMARYYEKWLRERIPALGDRSPLQAARSKAGRETVAALVRQIERDGQRSQPPLDPEIVRRLRERLGIA